MKIYYKLPDGSFESSFATDYSITPRGEVWSRKRQQYILPDMKGRVWLSYGGERKRLPVKKLLQDSLYAMNNSELIVHKFTIGKTKEVKLLEYTWRIPINLSFLFDTHAECQIYVRDAWEDDDLHDKFMKLISSDKLRHMPAFRPTYTQFANWSIKYTDGLSTLQGAYDLYREPAQYAIPKRSVSIMSDDTRHLLLNSNGSMTVVSNNSITTTQPQQHAAPTPSTSSMLTNNRLVFEETAGLLTGPLKPLLTWAFRGAPQEGHVLYNITGNESDFSASNYVWVPEDHRNTYEQMRRWLTRRWYYEVIG